MGTHRRATAVLLSAALTGSALVALAGSSGAAAPGGVLFYGLTPGNGLLGFRSGGASSPPVPITGLDADDVLVGIDVRPSTGELVAVGRGPSTGDDTLYVIDPSTATARAVGTPLTTDLVGSSFGTDVDPVVDRLRVISDSGQNLRVDLVTGAVTADAPLRPALLTADPVVTGVAHTNSRVGATSTTLFSLDTERNAIYLQEMPASGNLVVTGALANPPAAGGSGFDIDGLTGTGYATLDVNGQIGLYTVALPTSPFLLAPPVATRIGTTVLPGVTDLAVATPRLGFPGPDAVRASEGDGVAVVPVTRLGDTSEPASVEFAVTPGTARAGTDYAQSAGTALFAAGAATASIRIPLVRDAVAEPAEDFTVTLSEPSPNALLLASVTRTVTVTDGASTPAPSPTASPTPTPTPTRTATSLTSASTPVVRFPAPVTVTGALRLGGAPLPGRTVFVVATPRDRTAAPKVVATALTGAGGAFSTAFRAVQHSQLAVVFNGTAEEAPSTSRTSTSLVQYANPTITGPAQVRPGAAVTFRGSVQPGAVRPRVVLQLIGRDGALTGLALPVTATATGAYAVSRSFRVPGTFRVRVLAVSSAKNLASASRTFTLTVR